MFHAMSPMVLSPVAGQAEPPRRLPADPGGGRGRLVPRAGGFTDCAATNLTKIVRTHAGGRQETLVVDPSEVIKRGRKDKDVPLAAHGVIVVAESPF